jgi:(2Fe-2S) ferredoxin
VLSIFSDERLKQDVTLLYRRDDGVGVYRYRYRDEPVWYKGLIAQDVQRVYPEHIYPFGELLTVDYSALGEAEEIILRAA